jgi:Membrane domain of glycerophosphoryl diester phosphodiesterase
MSGTFDDSKNPYRPTRPIDPIDSPGQPIPADSSAPPAAEARFGDFLNRALSAYGAQWSQWPLPMLVAGLIFLASMCLCYFPMLLAMGPLSCGLYECAFRGLRGQPIDTGALGRGWERLGTSMLAGFALMLLQLAPMLLMYAAMFLFIAMTGAFAGGAGGGGRGPGGGGNEMTPLIFLPFLAFMSLMMFAIYAWMLWIGTRTMFVLPLVADRGCSFSTAWGMSWDATRTRFWELLLLNFVAAIIGVLGIYACYVGVIFTLPLYYLTIAAAYDGRLGIESGGKPGPATVA